MFSALAYNHGKLNEKINLFVALAPVTNLGKTEEKVIKLIGNLEGAAKKLMELLEINEI